MIDTNKYDPKTEALKSVTKALKEMTEEELEEWKQKMYRLIPSFRSEEE